MGRDCKDCIHNEACQRAALMTTRVIFADKPTLPFAVISGVTEDVRRNMRDAWRCHTDNPVDAATALAAEAEAARAEIVGEAARGGGC